MLEDTRFSAVLNGYVRLLFVEEERVAIIAVVHVDDIFTVGLRSRCDVFRDEFEPNGPRQELG